MRLPIYQIDAFTSSVFGGNPAAVCVLDDWPGNAWPADELMQAIAAENNLSETAFIRKTASGYDLRWFSPTVEVGLCGHATLAAGYAVLERLEPESASVTFRSHTDTLTVARHGSLLAMNFPSMPPRRTETPASLVQALGGHPVEVWQARDFLVVYRSEAEVRALRPDFEALRREATFGVIVTAPGTSADFVSRFFAPSVGIPEDPVTGSAHCTLVPYWSQRLDKTSLHARQISARGGELFCELKGNRVILKGHAALYLEGAVHLPSRIAQPHSTSAGESAGSETSSP